MARRRIGQQLHDRQCGHRLAGARLADQRQRFALADVERHPIDRQRGPPTLSESDRKVFDGEQRLGGRVHAAHRNVLRGSKASRTASPMKIKSDSMMATAKKPESPSHGAWML